MQKAGQSLTELKTKIAYKIISNVEIVKALIIEDKDFLNAIPTAEENILLANPETLIRQQIMLTKNKTSITNEALPYITSAYVNFKKSGHMFQSGMVYFYIIIPNELEQTDYGIRYDYIAERLEEVLSDWRIGEFEFYERGDMNVDVNNLGHYISFKILDFHFEVN